jgi:ABC-2 type transport system permease protein
LNLLLPVFKLQLTRYLRAPATYLSIAMFLALSTTLGLDTLGLLEQNSSDLQNFFEWHPWLYLLFIPALSIQLWTDEQQTGLSELLKLLPVSSAELVIGKFLAAWTIVALTLALTFPLVVMVNMLGTVDNSVIAAQYLVSGLLAASYLSIGCFMCALSHQRLLTSVLTLSLLLTISGLSSVLDALEHQAPIWIVDSLTALSPLIRFGMIDHGALALHDMLYFISLTIALLAATTIVLNYKKS